MVWWGEYVWVMSLGGLYVEKISDEQERKREWVR